MRMPRVSAHGLSKPLTYSGPLSTRMTCGAPPPFYDLGQAAHDTHRWQREVHLDAQTLSIEVIQYVQRPKVPTICKLILHEVHRPCVVGGGRHCQFIWFRPLQTLARPDTQVQLQFAVNPIHGVRWRIVRFVPFSIPYGCRGT